MPQSFMETGSRAVAFAAANRIEQDVAWLKGHGAEFAIPHLGHAYAHEALQLEIRRSLKLAEQDRLAKTWRFILSDDLRCARWRGM